LKRLVSVASTPTAWTQTYQYDGFGNLTGKADRGECDDKPAHLRVLRPERQWHQVRRER
jgi:YD repeat-containing protein